jgi:tetratricopeptide (TPR) repeat protein
VAEAAALEGEAEVRAIALAMWGAVLGCVGRDVEAKVVFDVAIAHCTATGDRLHLAVAYESRVFLWQKLGAVEKSLEDLQRCVAIARELGHAQVERMAVFNHAELLYFLGRPDEALPLARRAHELGLRFFGEHPVAVDALLLARIALALGDIPEARRQLDWIQERCARTLAPDCAVLLGLVRQGVAQAEGCRFSPEAWEGLLEAARRDSQPNELIEILLNAARSAATAGERECRERWVGEAMRLADDWPMWRAQLDAL